MAIAPVSSVSFRNNYYQNNQVSFEGKKKDGSHHSSGISNTLKSIPVAALIAMSPLVSNTAQSQVLAPNEVCIGSGTDEATLYDGWKRKYTLYLISNDGDNNTYEKTRLRVRSEGKFSGIDETIQTEYEFEPTCVRYVADVVDGKLKNEYYFVFGKDGYLRDASKNKPFKKYNVEQDSGMPITEDVYESIKYAYNNKIPVQLWQVDRTSKVRDKAVLFRINDNIGNKGGVKRLVLTEDDNYNF